MSRIAAAFLLTAALGFINGCAALKPTEATHDRLRECFQIPEDQPVTPDAIQQALEKELTVGVTDSYVRAFLKSRGIGENGNELIYPDLQTNGLYCKIMSPPETMGWRKPIYLIYFQLDQNNRLTDIIVQVDYKTPPKRPEMSR